MSLRIGIDARTLSLERPTGVERVVYQYLESLGRLAPAGHEYLLFVDRDPGPNAPAPLPGRLVVVPPRMRRLSSLADLWLALQMRSAMKEHDLDAFVSMNTKFPITKRACFTTVHGLEWYFCPREYRLKEKIKQWAWFQLCTRRSRGLITFTEHTAADIRRIRPRCELPVCVVPEGVAPHFRRLAPQERDPAALAELGVRAPFVLSVCSHEPRKNLDGLIRAFAAVAQRDDLPHQLVLVGRSGWKSARLRELIAELGLGERVLLPGYVSDEQLLQAYNQAELFVYPSKYEGFGLPLVEAMACGAPIVTSDSSSMKEVAAGAAVLVDPHSPDDIARGLSECLVGADAAGRREELVRAGLQRVEMFSWDQMTLGITRFLTDQLHGGGAPPPGAAR